jgi:hypothetical protein
LYANGTLVYQHKNVAKGYICVEGATAQETNVCIFDAYVNEKKKQGEAEATLHKNSYWNTKITISILLHVCIVSA